MHSGHWEKSQKMVGSQLMATYFTEMSTLNGNEPGDTFECPACQGWMRYDSLTEERHEGDIVRWVTECQRTEAKLIIAND